MVALVQELVGSQLLGEGAGILLRVGVAGSQPRVEVADNQLQVVVADNQLQVEVVDSHLQVVADMLAEVDRLLVVEGALQKGPFFREIKVSFA